MAERFFPSYREDNSQRKYPFTDDSTLVAEDGSFELLPELVLDALIFAAADVEGFSLSEIDVSGGQITFRVASTPAGVVVEGLFAITDPSDRVALEDEYGRTAGVLVFHPDRLTHLTTLAPGTYVFGAGRADFVPSCVVPRGAYSLEGFVTERGELLTGDIVLVGEYGAVWHYQLDADTGEAILRPHFVGDALFRRRLLGDEAIRRPIETINGIGPDASGRFLIVPADSDGATPLRIRPVAPDRIRIELIGRTRLER